jgi:hypothetical protein
MVRGVLGSDLKDVLKSARCFARVDQSEPPLAPFTGRYAMLEVGYLASWSLAGVDDGALARCAAWVGRGVLSRVPLMNLVVEVRGMDGSVLAG